MSLEAHITMIIALAVCCCFGLMTHCQEYTVQQTQRQGNSLFMDYKPSHDATPTTPEPAHEPKKNP